MNNIHRESILTAELHILAERVQQLQAQRDDLLEALKAYGAHTSNCDYLMLLTSLPPRRQPCSCGLHAAIAKGGKNEINRRLGA